MEFIIDLHSKLDGYQVKSFITCIGQEVSDIHPGVLSAWNEEKGMIDKVLKMWNNYC